ncbi:aspartate carbamoyltransferase [Candidatus Saccharibacteria bacterium]|nr:aspartate carbamoyltransferase [Candidatus Saccharibacteria bacterium]
MIGKDITTVRQFDKSDIDRVISLSKKLEKYLQTKGELDLLKDKILASLFFEPSTRTRFSFEAAMERLGGKIISATGMSGVSMGKGESLGDTVRTVERFCDIIVMRHPDVGSSDMAAKLVKIPFIGAGDGSGEHPTQALVDFYTIKKAKPAPNLKIALIGDLKYGRTVRSLLELLIEYNEDELYFVAPDELQLPEEYYQEMTKKGVKFVKTNSLEKAVHECDVLYMTRIQKERFEDKNQYDQLKGYYVLNNQTIRDLKPDAVIMHPLPRIDEIATEIDSDPRAIYFDQVENAVYVRMAFLLIVFDRDGEFLSLEE